MSASRAVNPICQEPSRTQTRKPYRSALFALDAFRVTAPSQERQQHRGVLLMVLCFALPQPNEECWSGGSQRMLDLYVMCVCCRYGLEPHDARTTDSHVDVVVLYRSALITTDSLSPQVTRPVEVRKHKMVARGGVDEPANVVGPIARERNRTDPRSSIGFHASIRLHHYML